MSEDEYSPVPSVSPAMQDGELAAGPGPDLMNVSPVSEEDSYCTPGGNSLQPGSSSVQDALRHREWLQAQKLQLQIQLAMKTDNNTDIDSASKEEIAQLSEKLKDDLTTKTFWCDSREMFMKWQQMLQTAEDVLTSSEIGDHAALVRKRKLESLLNEFCRVSSEIGKENKEFQLLTEELEELKKKHFELLRKSRQLYAELAARKQEQEKNVGILSTDKKGKKLQEELKLKSQQNTMMRHVIQGLILGSGVDWAKSQDIQTLLLDCGNTITYT